MEKLIGQKFEFFSEETDDDNKTKLQGKVIAFVPAGGLSSPRVIIEQNDTSLIYVVSIYRLHKKI